MGKPQLGHAAFYPSLDSKGIARIRSLMRDARDAELAEFHRTEPLKRAEVKHWQDLASQAFDAAGLNPDGHITEAGVPTLIAQRNQLRARHRKLLAALKRLAANPAGAAGVAMFAIRRDVVLREEGRAAIKRSLR